MTTISAKVISDSIGDDAPRFTSVQLRYPRFIHSELMTHRVFSRNASSSRAIPVSRLIQDIIDDTAMPIHWGKNEPGMQAREEHEQLVNIGPFRSFSHPFTVSREEAWLEMRDQAIAMARAYSEAGYHKQIVNRILEPFVHINVLVTATEWDNFFELRAHPDAEPHIHLLALEVKKAMDASVPRFLQKDKWHVPYVSDEEVLEFGWEGAIKISTARCARVSYMTHDGRKPDANEDIALYERLVGGRPLHASPAEHQAKPDYVHMKYTIFNNETKLWSTPQWHGNFTGWIQNRKILEQTVL